MTGKGGPRDLERRGSEICAIWFLYIVCSKSRWFACSIQYLGLREVVYMRVVMCIVCGLSIYFGFCISCSVIMHMFTSASSMSFALIVVRSDVLDRILCTVLRW